jgi:hypothetical protein
MTSGDPAWDGRAAGLADAVFALDQLADVRELAALLS